MARTETTVQDNGIIRLTSGAVFDDAGAPDAASINLGFRPRYIRVVNHTDRIEYEWFQGMASATSLKTIANGTRSAEAAEGPTLAKDGKTIGFPVLQNTQYRWYALG
jgi:hypothetical protein